jgi:hypothetical protein
VKTDQEISGAVKDCLDRCYATGHTPLGAIAQYLAELRRQGWIEGDLKRVELSVRKVLAGVMKPGADD